MNAPVVQSDTSIVLKCSCRSFAGERILLLPAGWTVRPLHRALQVAFGWEDDHAFWLRDGEGRECSGTPVSNQSEHGLFFSSTLSELFHRDGKRLLYVYDEGDENEVILERLGEEEGDGPACREASGLMAIEDSMPWGFVDGIASRIRTAMADGSWNRIPEWLNIDSVEDAEAWLRRQTADAVAITERLREVVFDPECDCAVDKEGPSSRSRLPFMQGHPDNAGDDDEEVLDVEDIDEAAFEAFLVSTPPPPDPEPTENLAKRATDGDADALVEWALRAIPTFPHDAVESRHTPVILRGLARAVADGHVGAKAVAGRFLLEAPTASPAAFLRGWQLLQEAADSGLGTAWDALGRVCLDCLLIQGFPNGLDTVDPDHAVIPAENAFPAFVQKCFRHAIECGCTTGYNGLSWAVREGVGTEGGRKDYALADELDRKGADAGDSHSCFNLAFSLVNARDDNPETRRRHRLEALDLIVRGAEGANPIADDIDEAEHLMDDWRTFGKVSKRSRSARRFDAAVRRFDRINAVQEDDASEEAGEDRKKANRALIKVWMDAMARPVVSEGGGELEEGIRLLHLPDATRAQLHDGFHMVRKVAETTDSPAAWRVMAECYENGVGVYRSRNHARRCREAAERREALDMAAEALFTENV